MTRLKWTTNDTVAIGAHRIARSPDLPAQANQGIGVVRDPRWRSALKHLAWPLRKAHDDLLVDGFIEWEIGRLIARHTRPSDTFLEIGCGDLSLARFVGAGRYNALDVRLSAFHVQRHLDRRPDLNIALASASEIPVRDGVVDVFLSAETLTNIPDIAGTLTEMRRVARPGARLICSVPNELCAKYGHKGPNPGSVHRWSFAETIALLQDGGFSLVEGYWKGWWLPLPRWLTGHVSYHLPLRPRREADAIAFFFVFVFDPVASR